MPTLAGATAQILRCPYQAWTYGLDDRLVVAPNLIAMPDLDQVERGLVTVHLREWLGYAWVCRAAEPPSFEADVLDAAVEPLGDLASLEAYLVPDHVIVHRMFPMSAGRTIVECDWLYAKGVVAEKDVAHSVELFHRVNEQDFEACERTQPAMSSRAYADGGVLVPAEHHIGVFHDWLRDRVDGDART